jgi:hypothetical protein
MYRRAARNGPPQTAAEGKTGAGSRGERAAAAKGPEGRLVHAAPKAGAAFSAEKASRRTTDRLERRRAGRGTSAQTHGTSRASPHPARRRTGSSPGRSARVRTSRRQRTEPRSKPDKIRHKKKAEHRPKTRHKSKAGPKPKAERKAQAEPKAQTLKSSQLRPVLLSKVLGMDAIRPPKANLKIPDFSRLAEQAPRAGPDGKPLSLSPAQAKSLETMRPPDESTTDCRKPGRHWDSGPQPAYHEGQAWGLQRDGGWLWLKKSGKNWWAWTAPNEPTWLWHAGHWWWRSDGIWFMLHQGEVWGYREFGERRAEGLIHPGTGTQLEYSADGKRVAMITPGDGAWLFDAVSGAVVGRWTEAQMPAKPKPHAPHALVLPP